MFRQRIVPETDNIFKEMHQLRRMKGISLLAISKQTKIPLKFLKSLEEGSTEMLPDVLYLKNIIKKYLNSLNIDEKPFIKKLKTENIESRTPKKALKKESLVVVPRIIKTVIIIFLISTLLIYLAFEIKNIFEAPKINIKNPQDGAIVNENIIEIKGSTEPGTKIFINDKQVLLDKLNEFKKEINLQKGLNLIKITGINRYSKENIIWRNVILEIE